MKLKTVLNKKFDGLFVKLPFVSSPFDNAVVSVMNGEVQIINEYGNKLDILSESDDDKKYVYVEEEGFDGKVLKHKHDIEFLDIFITGADNCENVKTLKIDNNKIFVYKDENGAEIFECLKENEEVTFLIEFRENLKKAIYSCFDVKAKYKDEMFSKVSLFNNDGDMMSSKTIVIEDDYFIEITADSIINEMSKDIFETEYPIKTLSDFIAYYTK